MDLVKIRKIIPKILDNLKTNNVTAQEWEKISNFINKEYETKKMKSTLPERDKETFQKLLSSLL